MRKKLLATIIAAGLVAVAAFAGANGLTETQAACEHSQVKDGACVDCNDPVECIEVEDASGTAKGTYSKLEDAAAAAGNGDILKLLYNCESTSAYIDAGNKNLTIDLNKKKLKAVYFEIMGSLVIENGEYSGYIKNAATGNEHTLTFENVRADLTQLGWYAKGGLKLVNSNIEQQHDDATFTEWWLEKLQMDQTSVYKITNSPSGLSNYGLLSLDEAVGGIEEFLPAGYTLDGQPNSYNTILDETGTKARSVELRYRRLTDAKVSVSIDPTSYVYDGTAKEPTVTVTYDGKKLIAGTDYTCIFSDNINVGTASVKITAKSKTYHGEIVKNYTIEMDQTSVYKITNSPSGLSNYGLLSLDEAVGGIEEFLPAGYTLDGQPNSYNTILDETGTKARSVELRYRRLTDAKVSVSIDPTSYVYDGTAKEPTVTVTYDGKKLIAGTDYTCIFSDNINVGTASVKITAKSKTYHGEIVKNYTIEKAPQAAPTGLTAVNESATGKKDGSVANAAVTMEYSTDQTTWTAVTGTVVNGLAAGDYLVRYKESANYYASPSAKVTVGLAASNTTEASTTESVTTESVTTENTTTETASSEDTTTEDATDEEETEDVDTEDETTEVPREDETEATGDKGKNDQKKTGVKTGDAFAMKAAVAGMLISLGMACVVIIRKRRK